MVLLRSWINRNGNEIQHKVLVSSVENTSRNFFRYLNHKDKLRETCNKRHVAFSPTSLVITITGPTRSANNTRLRNNASCFDLISYLVMKCKRTRVSLLRFINLLWLHFFKAPTICLGHLS